MAKKNYAFEWGYYFTGVEQANMYTYLRDIFFKNISRPDAPRPITAQNVMDALLGETEYNFIKSDSGNFSYRIRGIKSFPARNRKEQYAFQRRECAADNGWLGRVLKDIDDNTSEYYTEETAGIKVFFATIMENKDDIPGDIRFDPLVLQGLLDALDFSFQQLNASPASAKKRIYTRCLIMGLTYFLSNGETFLDLTLTEESPLTSRYCLKYAQRIPKNDFEQDDRLIINFSCPGRKPATLTELIDNAGDKHVFLTGDGGLGKTTAMRLAAAEYNSRGVPAVYIPCSRADSLAEDGLPLQNFIAGYIGSVFDDYEKLAADSHNIYQTVKELLDKNIPYSRVIVMLDGLNETSAAPALCRQVTDFGETVDRLQFVISSRYTAYQFTDSFLQAKAEPLQPANILPAEQCAVYSALDARTKALLASPMFLRLFMESDSRENITATSLLMQDFNRNIQKNLVPSFLRVFLPDFAMHCYANGRKMTFNRETLSSKAAEYKFTDVDYIVNSRKMSGYVLTDDDYNFVFRHEHIRDFFAALSVYQQINACSTDEDYHRMAARAFSSQKKYSIYIRRFLAELAGKDTVIKILETLSADSLPPQIWHSDENAAVTANVVELLKIITDNRPGIDFYGLNLSLTALNGTEITDAYFARSIISDFTFSPQGHDSAVFALSSDSEGNVCALGRNLLIKYSPQMEQTDAVGYPGGHTITSHAAYRNVLGAVNAGGTGYIFNTHGKLTVLGSVHGAVSVRPSTGGLLFGFTDGSVAFFDTYGKAQWRVQVDSRPVMPVRNKVYSEIVYATEDSLNIWTRRGGSEKLWSTDAGMKIIRTAYNSTCRSAVMVVNTFGRTNVVAYYEDKEKAETVMETTVTEKLSEYLVQQSIGIDLSKCTAIAFDGRYMLNAYNSGNIMVYRYTDSGWQYVDDMPVVKSKNDNLGIGVESACFVAEGVVCGLTDRTVKMLSCSFKDVTDNGLEKHRVSGHNNGLRRIVMADENNLYVTMYDHGYVHLTRAEGGKFAFADKLQTGSEWCWAGAALADGRCAFAAGDTVYIHDNKPSACHRFGKKVENLLAKDNVLFSACGGDVYLTDCDKNYKTEKLTGNDGRRPISFATDPLTGNVYAGFSSFADRRTGCIVKVFDGTEFVTVKKSLWKYADGWYRSMEFSSDGQFILCSGLKEQKPDGRWQDVSVLFDRGFNQLAVLEGHASSVMKGLILSADNSALLMATCSYDGYINVYKCNCNELGPDARFSPAKTSPEAGGRLLDMVKDGDDVLACCMDGRLYRWTVRGETGLTVDYENICGLWTSYCDMTGIDDSSVVSDGMYRNLAALNNQIPEVK